MALLDSEPSTEPTVSCAGELSGPVSRASVWKFTVCARLRVAEQPRQQIRDPDRMDELVVPGHGA